MWALYELYETDMLLQEPIRPSSVFADELDQWTVLKDQAMVYAESSERTDVYKMSLLLSRTLQAIQPQKAPVGPGPAAGAVIPAPTQRPIWGPQVSFTPERESWSVE